MRPWRVVAGDGIEGDAQFSHDGSESDRSRPLVVRDEALVEVRAGIARARRLPPSEPMDFGRRSGTRGRAGGKSDPLGAWILSRALSPP